MGSFFSEENVQTMGDEHESAIVWPLVEAIVADRMNVTIPILREEFARDVGHQV